MLCGDIQNALGRKTAKRGTGKTNLFAAKIYDFSSQIKETLLSLMKNPLQALQNSDWRDLLKEAIALDLPGQQNLSKAMVSKSSDKPLRKYKKDTKIRSAKDVTTSQQTVRRIHSSVGRGADDGHSDHGMSYANFTAVMKDLLPEAPSTVKFKDPLPKYRMCSYSGQSDSWSGLEGIPVPIVAVRRKRNSTKEKLASGDKGKSTESNATDASKTRTRVSSDAGGAERNSTSIQGETMDAENDNTVGIAYSLQALSAASVIEQETAPMDKSARKSIVSTIGNGGQQHSENDDDLEVLEIISSDEDDEGDEDMGEEAARPTEEEGEETHSENKENAAKKKRARGARGGNRETKILSKRARKKRKWLEMEKERKAKLAMKKDAFVQECKFWINGACKAGDECKFLHIGTVLVLSFLLWPLAARSCFHHTENHLISVILST